ncbi:uncharacterized protein LOC131848388 [Achroia grisella]|uniref:uncharacterized protein LOC131848388 n=1 Tax=Achroia grisella TaxID=688607 RepID=UPI0027D327BE|nr:uncharacterized protein LOC131848388 [Achroia grisella]
MRIKYHAIIPRCTKILKIHQTNISNRTEVTLSYKIIGEYHDTVPIVLFHELLGCKKHWESLGKTMLNVMKRSVIAVDLRNHGDSPHVSSHKYEEMASDVLQLFKKLSINNACLVGHSMGGRTCMCLSLMAPHQVSELIVVDTSPISTTSHLTDYYPKVLANMKAVDFKHSKTVSKARKDAKRDLKQSITDDTTLFVVLSNVNIKKDGTIGWTCNVDVLIKHFKDIAMFPISTRMKRYNGPTLFIGGQFSEYIPTGRFDGNSDTVSASSYPNIQLNSIENGMDILYFRYYVSSSMKYIYNISHIRKRSAVDLAHIIHGKKPKEGTPIFILHGLLGAKKNWESMSKKIASSMQKSVIAIDARNHGESPHDPSHTYLNLASDVVQLMNKLSVKQIDIIGHSMGGRTAMVVALTEPLKISHLVVVDISPVPTTIVLDSVFPKLLDFMKTIKFHYFKNLVEARADVKKKLMASGVIENEGMSNFILMNIGTKPDKSIGWNCNIPALKENFKYIATFPTEVSGKQYSGPTLFIAGKESSYILPSHIDTILKYFPKAELKYVPGTGHNVHAEDPSTFYNLVTQFLSK